jgi:hypothetical protein
MAVIVGSANRDVIHVAGDGFAVPPGYAEINTATGVAEDITAGAQANILLGDNNGDGAADFRNRLVGAPVVTVSDLIL